MPLAIGPAALVHSLIFNRAQSRNSNAITCTFQLMMLELITGLVLTLLMNVGCIRRVKLQISSTVSAATVQKCVQHHLLTLTTGYHR